MTLSVLASKRKGRGRFPASGGGGTIEIARSDFASGNINPPFMTPTYPGANPVIVSDTANLFGGGTSAKILHIPFTETPLTRAVTRQVNADEPTKWASFGDELTHEGTFFIEDVAQTPNILRKLFYWFTRSGTGTGGFCVIGSENDNLYVELLAGRITISPAVPVSVGVAHFLRARATLNSAYNVNDGTIDVYLDDVVTPVASATGLNFLSDNGTYEGYPDRLFEFATGDQLQGDGSQVAESRWWKDDILITKGA